MSIIDAATVTFANRSLTARPRTVHAGRSSTPSRCSPASLNSARCNAPSTDRCRARTVAAICRASAATSAGTGSPTTPPLVGCVSGMAPDCKDGPRQHQPDSPRPGPVA